LLGDFRFTGNHIQLQLRVREIDDQVTGFDLCAVLDINGFDPAAFDGIEKHRFQWCHLATHRDVVVEFTIINRRYDDAVILYLEGASGVRF